MNFEETFRERLGRGKQTERDMLADWAADRDNWKAERKEQDQEIERLREELELIQDAEVLMGGFRKVAEERAEKAEAKFAEIKRYNEILKSQRADVYNEGVEDGKSQAGARVKELEESLYDHRADLHCYSSRPCPTCRNSAIVLGIADKVPYCCAREETDREARRLLAEKEKI